MRKTIIKICLMLMIVKENNVLKEKLVWIQMDMKRFLFEYDLYIKSFKRIEIYK